MSLFSVRSPLETRNERAQRLAVAIATSGLRRVEIARRTGVHISNLLAYESGRHVPSERMLARVLDVIGEMAAERDAR